ncbi:MAG: tail fiber domain-containing protein [Flavobacteriia bacterium]|nr:tail fiber domain-containing protein [Flavobacteriia bacterium]
MTYQSNKGFAFEGGNVGIGTTSPGVALQIQNNAGNNSYVLQGLGNNIDKNRIFGILDTHIPSTNRSAGALALHESDSTTNIFLSAHPDADSYINNGGKVGIGTASPEVMLDVDGKIQIQSDQFWFKGENFRLIDRSSGDSVERMRIDSDGNVGIGTTNPFAKLHLQGSKAVASADVEDQLIFHRGFNSGVQDTRFGALSFGTSGNLGHAGRLDFKLSSSYATPGSVPTNLGDVTTVMTLDGSGKVGIGTTNPFGKLHVVANETYADPYNYRVNPAVKIRNDAQLEPTVLSMEGENSLGSNMYGNIIWNSLNSQLESYFAINADIRDANHLVIRGDGNVGIGTTDPVNILHIHGDSSDENGDVALRIQNPNSGTTTTSSIRFTNTTSTFDHAAIVATREGSHPNLGSLQFYTNQNSNSGTPAMTIDSVSNVGIGTTDPSGIVNASTALNAFAYIKNGGHGVFTSNSIGPGIYINKTNASTSQATDYINFRNKGTKVGGIEYDGTDVLISQDSDERLKTNIKDSESGLNVINSLQVRSFDWINDSRRSKRFGFVAQEMQEVFEEAVKVGGEDENEDPWGIYDTKLIPILTKAIQEQQQLIEQLKSQNESQQSTIDSLVSRIENLENK